MLDFIQGLLIWLASSFGLLAMIVLWAIVIFVIVDEIVGLIKGDSNESEDE